MNSYFQGNLVRGLAQFKNPSNVLTDPTVIIARIKNPVGVETVYTYPTDAQLVRESTGVYHVDIDANLGGPWEYRFEGTGAVQAASQDSFLCIAANPA